MLCEILPSVRASVIFGLCVVTIMHAASEPQGPVEIVISVGAPAHVHVVDRMWQAASGGPNPPVLACQRINDLDSASTPVSPVELQHSEISGSGAARSPDSFQHEVYMEPRLHLDQRMKSQQLQQRQSQLQSPELEEDKEEGQLPQDEVLDEDDRRREWITFYWSLGDIDRAYELGWGGEWERRHGGLVPTLATTNVTASIPSSSSAPTHSPAGWPYVTPPARAAGAVPRAAAFSPGVSAGGVLRSEPQPSEFGGARLRSKLVLCSALVALAAAIGLVAVCIILFVVNSPPESYESGD